MDPLKKKRFLWGLLLAWAPWLPTLVGLANTFRGIAAEKATGIGVIACGLAETFLLFGLISTVVFEVAAIFFLARAFEPGRWLRSLVLALSVCASALMLCFFGLFLWLNSTRHRM